MGSARASFVTFDSRNGTTYDLQLTYINGEWAILFLDSDYVPKVAEEAKTFYGLHNVGYPEHVYMSPMEVTCNSDWDLVLPDPNNEWD